MDNRFTILVIEVGVAVVVQIGVLIALLVVLRKSSARVESLAGEVQRRLVPTLETAHTLLEGNKEKLEKIVEDLSTVTSMARQQFERMDSTISDVLDRTRLQVIRADELVSRTLDKVEETTEIVQHTVVSPVRHISGVMQGITAGVGALFGRRRPQKAGVPQDEMFI